MIIAVAAVALHLLALGHSVAVVRGLEWPALDTQYRELAAAQTMLDQGFGPDSTYRGERVWYNPMSAWLVAGLSRATGTAPRVVVARSGSYLNLIAPIAFGVAVALVFDRLTALGALAAFIFLIGLEFPSFFSATYSPWFGAENFGQAFFYLGLVAALLAFERTFSFWPTAGLGLLVGLTFLAHTAPALVLGGAMVTLAAWQARDGRSWRDPGSTLAVSLGVAFLIALPFAAEILGHYHLTIVNGYPSLSPSDALDLNELPVLVMQLASVPALAAGAALVWRMARMPRDRGGRLLVAWLVPTAFFLGGHLVAQLAEKGGITLPAIVPAFHFFLYFTALLSVGFGLAITEVSAAVARRIGGPGAAAAGPRDWRAVAFGVAATLALVAWYYPAYLARPDFTSIRAQADRMNRELPADAYDWIRANTSPDDVFLCTDDESLYVIAPAGRKVVATNRYFSNPYVDWATRDRDRREMFNRLEHRDLEGFRALAAKYGVTYVMLPARMPSDFWLKVSGLRRSELPAVRASELRGSPGFRSVFEGTRTSILAVDRPSD